MLGRWKTTQVQLVQIVVRSSFNIFWLTSFQIYQLINKYNFQHVQKCFDGQVNARLAMIVWYRNKE